MTIFHQLIRKMSEEYLVTKKVTNCQERVFKNVCGDPMAKFSNTTLIRPVLQILQFYVSLQFT